MKLKKMRIFIVAIICLTVILIAWKISSKGTKKKNEDIPVAEEVVYQDNIRLGICEFDTINPIISKNKNVIYIDQLMFEPLVSLNNDYSIELRLAKEYAKTSTSTYIVKVDNNIKWSDGSKFSAEDVKFTVDNLKSFNNIYSENVKHISNVDVIDENTVKFVLDEEVPFFEYNLIFPIMCKSYYNGDNILNSTKQPIGTGLYKISNVSENQIILEKNENYRNLEQTNKKINNIYINIFNNVGEIYNSFKLGNIDVMYTSSITYTDYIGTIGYNIKEFKGRELDFLSINCNDYLMKEKSVRQAINYAIDRDNIISSVYNNNYYTSDYILDYDNYLYKNKSASSGYNPEKAKEILESDGWVYNNNRWKKNGNVLSFSISVNASNDERCAVANIIKSQLESIGIIVNVKEVSDSQYNYYLANKNYQVLLTGVNNSYSPDLSYFYNEGNIANYNNENVKYIIKDIINITDNKMLEEKYKILYDIAKEDCPYISLYRNKNTLLINQNVIGSFTPNNFKIFYNFETWGRE